MPDQARLRRLAVVRGNGEQGVRSGPLRLRRQLDRVRGVIGPDACYDRRPVADSAEHGGEQALLFRVRRGRGLACGTADHETVIAHVFNEVGGEPGGAVVVQRAIGRHRRDHRGQHPAERRSLLTCHEPNATRLGRSRQA